MNSVKFHGAMHPKRAIKFKPYWHQEKILFTTQPIVRRRFVFAIIMTLIFVAVVA